MSRTKTPPPTSRSIARALGWARGRAVRRRSRRLFLGGLCGVLGLVCAAALWTDWSTVRLAIVGGGAALGAGALAWAVARAWPLPSALAARVADRGLALGDRLLTGLDPAAAGPFAGVVRGELDARLGDDRLVPTGTVTRSPRWLRRWRLHLLIALLLVLLFSLHGVFGPGLRLRPGGAGGDRTVPATVGGVEATLELAIDAGASNPFARGAPIPVRVRLRGGAGAVRPLRVRIDEASPLALAQSIGPDGDIAFDLGPAFRRTGREQTGRHVVRAFIEADDGRRLESDPLEIVIGDGSGDGGGAGGESEQSDTPDAADRPKDEPAREEPSNQPPPMGAPERVEIVRRPFFVAPLVDENGDIVDGERWTLEYLTGGGRSARAGGGDGPTSLRDLLQRYERQAERAMARDAVPAHLRDVYRRYLRELTRR